MKVKSESEVTQSCPTLSDRPHVAYQAPPSMGFSRQEYWSGVPLPSPVLMLVSVKQTVIHHWQEYYNGQTKQTNTKKQIS